MNKQEFLDMVRNPNSLTAGAYEKLEEVVTNFPYCQSAHLLLAKLTNEESSMLAKQKLNKAAAYTLERRRLRKLLSRGTKDNTIRETPDKPATTTSSSDIPTESKIGTASPENLTSKTEIVPEEISSHKSAPEIESREVEVKSDVSEKLDFQEKVSTNSKQIKNGFFEELERNLERLKKLKSENDIEGFLNYHKEEIPEKVQIKEITMAPENIPEKEEMEVEEKSDVFEEKIINEVQEIAKEEHSLNEEALPDTNPDDLESEHTNKTPFVELMESDEDNIITAGSDTSDHYDLLIKYLDYLSTRKKKRPLDKNKINHLIDKFIQEDPTIPYYDIKKAGDTKETSEDLAAPGFKGPKMIASESFAQLLIRQSKFKKAIEVYEKLILKNPEKKDYFAQQIQELKNKL